MTRYRPIAGRRNGKANGARSALATRCRSVSASPLGRFRFFRLNVSLLGRIGLQNACQATITASYGLSSNPQLTLIKLCRVGVWLQPDPGVHGRGGDGWDILPASRYPPPNRFLGLISARTASDDRYPRLRLRSFLDTGSVIYVSHETRGRLCVTAWSGMAPSGSHWWRVATRYDQYVHRCLDFLYLAGVWIWLTLNIHTT